jgi:cephalosporin-C deacetylase-like acetyl esterase
MPRLLSQLAGRLSLVIALLAGFPLHAPAEDMPGDVMIDKYLAGQAAKLNQRFLDGANTLEEWQSKRPRLKQEYLDMLGLWPLPEKTPLHTTVTGKLERDDFIIEKLHFQSRPGLYVTGNLYRPKTSTGRLPTVLYVCGHSGRGRDGNKTAFQDHGMWFATHGYVCLIIDTLQLGEIPGIHHGTYCEGRWWWQARGYTPAGVECWNGIRAIDYLVSRPDVDPDRLAVTGISGGGAATFWIAAADDRVRCAVPVSGMSDLESYVTHKVINGHCDCMFLINTYQWEWTTIAALIAPRPLLFCNSDKDSIFPMDGNERIIARLRKLYAMYGKPDFVNDHVSHGGHDYRPDLRIAIFQWINKHLKNEMGPVEDANFKPIAGKELRVFPEVKDIPKDAINSKIDESFVAKADVKLPEAGKFEEWKKGLMKELQEKTFRAFPERIPEANNCRLEENGLSVHEVCSTELGIELTLDTFGKKYPRDSATGMLLVSSPNDGAQSFEWAESYRGDGLGNLLWLRGSAPNDWTRKSPPNYVERAHALLGRTADEGRVWDIAAIVHLQERGKRKTKWKVVGRGQAGILAAYAALFEPSISEVVIVDPPASHRNGPIFLNVLRVLDIPDALGMLVPRPLTLVNAKDKAFERTAAIYKRAGAADKFRQQEEK